MYKIIILLLIPLVTFAVSAYPGKLKFVQSDQESFYGHLKGDEWFNWIEDEKGEVILYNQASKDYEYAKFKEKNGTLDIIPSGIKVRNFQTGHSASKQNALRLDKKMLPLIWKHKREEALKYRRGN